MNKFGSQLHSLLLDYINDPEDIDYNGEFSTNGAPIRTRNKKTIEGFAEWLSKNRNS